MKCFKDIQVGDRVLVINPTDIPTLNSDVVTAITDKGDKIDIEVGNQKFPIEGILKDSTSHKYLDYFIAYLDFELAYREYSSIIESEISSIDKEIDNLKYHRTRLKDMHKHVTLNNVLMYNVGDKVRIKSIEWFVENKGEDTFVDCGTDVFTALMSKLCGKVMTIESIEERNGNYFYKMAEDHVKYGFNDFMIDCKVNE